VEAATTAITQDRTRLNRREQWKVENVISDFLLDSNSSSKVLMLHAGPGKIRGQSDDAGAGLRHASAQLA
jgi:hypothetical protein